MSALNVPVLAISFFKSATSLFDIIDKVPINACHLAASPATIPVDTPLDVVNPSISGKFPVENI